MTVMNNTFDNTATFSTSEIVAARNAFLQYELTRQAELLTVMPIEESMGVLRHCSVAHVQHLLDILGEQGHQRQADEYAHRLGVIPPRTNLLLRMMETLRTHRKVVTIMSLVMSTMGVVGYLSFLFLPS